MTQDAELSCSSNFNIRIWATWKRTASSSNIYPFQIFFFHSNEIRDQILMVLLLLNAVGLDWTGLARTQLVWSAKSPRFLLGHLILVLVCSLHNYVCSPFRNYVRNIWTKSTVRFFFFLWFVRYFYGIIKLCYKCCIRIL